MPPLTYSGKVTFSLPRTLMVEVRRAVEDGMFPSQNALVRKAIEDELKRIGQERLRQEFMDAAQDPMFMKDISDTEEEFSSSDSETSRMLPDD
ncbi:MAG: hypothetical protein O3B01_11960 [Planctomycetota bacterium]|nr:hypothetical protein [Planctomycetota bacterium]MDA1139291.1 hypothetical protein [Planctomycetota bacterium]